MSMRLVAASVLVGLLGCGGDDASVPDGGGPNDRDGDGVSDAADNCADASNANQANEDADALGDRCDPCPVIAETEPGSGDTDGDGVGNLCDPNPTTAGDALALFEGFFAGVPSGWTTTGTWLPVNAGLVNTGKSSLVLPNASTGSETLTVQGLVTSAPSDPNMATGIALGDPFDETAKAGIDCELKLGGSPLAGFLSIVSWNSTPTDVVNQDFAFEVGVAYRFSLTRKANQYTCHVVTPDATVTGMSASPTSSTAMDVFMSGDGRVDWVMIVTSP
jgi:hypothetical protein